jgi:hypothetical protein
MKTSFLMSVALASALSFSTASAAITFDYQAAGGIIEGQVTDHDLSREVAPDCLTYFRHTLQYRDGFSYDIPPFWDFDNDWAAANVHEGLSWGKDGATEPAVYVDPFPLNTDRPADGICSEVMHAQSGVGLKSVLTEADANQGPSTTDKPSVVANGPQELFGYLVHFNRDINPSHLDGRVREPKGMDMNLSWTLKLYEEGTSTEVYTMASTYGLHFWETSNGATYAEGGSPEGECPRAPAGIRTVNWYDGSSHNFLGDGVVEAPKTAENPIGCSDAYNYEYLAGDPNTFDYDGKTFTINVEGFYKYTEVEPGVFECDGGAVFDTLWAVEDNETIACVKFNITYEEGDQGCTPGYWKQPQHLADWTDPYTPGSSFDAIFGVDGEQFCADVNKNAYKKLDGLIGSKCDGTLTLGEAIWMEGNDGSLAAIVRHATAALLNAANADINFPYSIGEIQAMVTEAFAGGTTAERIAEIHDDLADANELHNNDVCGYDEPAMIDTSI